MAFTLQTWARASVSANEPFQILTGLIPVGSIRGYNYCSGDTQAAIAAADYFNDVHPEITTGDWLFAYSYGDNAGTFYTFTNNAGAITTTPFNLINVVDTANIADLAVTAQKIANNTITDNQISLNGLTSLSLSKSLMQFASGQLSAVNIAAMYGDPVQLVAAQGANRIIRIHDFSCELAFNNVQFTGGGACGLQYGNTIHLGGPAASATFANGANVNIRAAQSQAFGVAGALNNQTVAATVNAGIFISNDTAAFAAGNSSVNWYMSYSVYTTT